MSELKAHRIVGMDERCARVDNDYYLKSEVDKVIAKLKKHNENYRFDNKNMLRKITKQDAELCHHKYKRCLEKVKWCKDKMQHYKYDDKVILYGFRFYEKWYKRWLELAKKFKEAK